MERYPLPGRSGEIQAEKNFCTFLKILIATIKRAEGSAPFGFSKIGLTN
jgi:hypothetical protein